MPFDRVGPSNTPYATLGFGTYFLSSAILSSWSIPPSGSSLPGSERLAVCSHLDLRSFAVSQLAPVSNSSYRSKKRVRSLGDPPFLANSRSDLHATFFATLFLLRKEFAAKILFLESFGGFGKGVGEILWKAADVRQNKLTRAQYLDEVTWTTKNGLRLQKQRISVVLHTAIAEQIVNELACGEGGRVHGAKCLTVLAGVA
ncbi:hypothetical protein EMIHUDRAFT_199707 [Emiliania huxleyi CCMP1516]|uniref:Uncharacterized protein n=2 Tax=Emiliania huxleyi TaxID=2903 RepID=A0A0D3L033_EMIH1|nr:hypothetical protein EMIHUDRAFT_199707 [Emiliania huxleyi CCMP1516]EOD41368.1 hypothetical protein EMIHUDRAFT_199707 [Emiliania huxleyi CCMP1516]|eukprot:XP_005793797.1 hypothetical protein EMIHUDRAFT_199707 [Emiliania huxleyi CCMP1516]